jgi:hypothetical protein
LGTGRNENVRLDALQHFRRADLEPRAPPPLVVEEPAGVTEMPERLFDEERVALRLVAHETDELLRRAKAGSTCKHFAHFIDREETRTDVDRTDVTQQRSDGVSGRFGVSSSSRYVPITTRGQRGGRRDGGAAAGSIRRPSGAPPYRRRRQGAEES